MSHEENSGPPQVPDEPARTPRRKRRKPSGNEIAQANAAQLYEQRWSSPDARKQLGKKILANALACGMSPIDAVQFTCDHDWLRSATTNRGPHRATVFNWLREVSFGDVDLQLDETGRMIEIAGKLDIDEQRRKILGRLDASILAWLAQSRAVAERALPDDTLERTSAIHAAQGRCEKIAQKYLELKVSVLHLDKIPPLERLDDPEVRRILRGHLERSLSYFTREERESYRALFTDEQLEANEQVTELRKTLM